MVRLELSLDLSLELDYTIDEPGCDFIFNIHAAHTARQRVIGETLSLSQDLPWRVETEAAGANRHLRLQADADGHLNLPVHCAEALSTDDEPG